MTSITFTNSAALVILQQAGSAASANSNLTSATDMILKTVNQVSSEPSDATKQASATINKALLDTAGTEDPYNSPGVGVYENASDIPDPNVRATIMKAEQWVHENGSALKADHDSTFWGAEVDDDTRSAVSQLSETMLRYNFAQEIVSNQKQSESISEQTGGLWQAGSSTIGDRAEETIANMPSALDDIVSKLSEAGMVITGDLTVTKGDGSTSFGKFQIADKTTGEVLVSHDGSGTMSYFRSGKLFQTGQVSS